METEKINYQNRETISETATVSLEDAFALRKWKIREYTSEKLSWVLDWEAEATQITTDLAHLFWGVGLSERMKALERLWRRENRWWEDYTVPLSMAWVLDEFERYSFPTIH